MKDEIKVVVFSDESCEYDLPGNPKEFLKWWQDKFDLVPAEYWDVATVDCSTTVSYDCSRLDIEIYYYRTETDEEEAARLEKEEDRRKFIEAQELRQFEKLKAKYGG